GVLNALTPALRGGNPLTPSTHRLRRGLPGYLILFAPHAFAPQRQLQTRESPSPLVFLHISTHFTATRGIPLSSSALKLLSFQRSEEHTSELQSRFDLVCRLLLEKKKELPYPLT